MAQNFSKLVSKFWKLVSKPKYALTSWKYALTSWKYALRTPKICTKNPKICTNFPKRSWNNIVTRFLNNFRIYGSPPSPGVYNDTNTWWILLADKRGLDRWWGSCQFGVPRYIKNLLMPLFWMGLFPVDFHYVKRPLRTKSVKRPIKVGKRPINEEKRPIKAKVLVGVTIGSLMGCFRAPPTWRKTAPLKRPIKRSMNKGQNISKRNRRDLTE